MPSRGSVLVTMMLICLYVLFRAMVAAMVAIYSWLLVAVQ